MSNPEKGDFFDQVVSANRVALLSYFQRRLANPADAAEAFGELLLTAWRSQRRMPADEIAARMWLYGVARNVLRNTRRTLSRGAPPLCSSSKSSSPQLLRRRLIHSTRTCGMPSPPCRSKTPSWYA